jgi:hypothetical protein
MQLSGGCFSWVFYGLDEGEGSQVNQGRVQTEGIMLMINVYL